MAINSVLFAAVIIGCLVGQGISQETVASVAQKMQTYRSDRSDRYYVTTCGGFKYSDGTTSYENSWANIYKFCGECVALVQCLCGVPNTAQWVQGDNLYWLYKNGYINTVKKYTAIATFNSGGKFGSPGTGKGQHAAIFLSADWRGIMVYDQHIHDNDKGGRCTEEHKSANPRLLEWEATSTTAGKDMSEILHTTQNPVPYSCSVCRNDCYKTIGCNGSSYSYDSYCKN